MAKLDRVGYWIFAAAVGRSPIRDNRGQPLRGRRFSPGFKGTIQYSLSLREVSGPPGPPGRALAWLLQFAATQKVPYRPWRFEPHKRKRRPKKFPLLMKPRSQLKAG